MCLSVGRDSQSVIMSSKMALIKLFVIKQPTTFLEEQEQPYTAFDYMPLLVILSTADTKDFDSNC